MARNYQISEAVEIIAEGTDVEAIQDLGRRYPLLVAKVAKATAGANVREVVELFSYMPEYLSANKVNKAIKEAALGDGTDADAGDDDAEEKPAAKKAPAKKAAPTKKAPAKKADDDPYAGKDAIELFKECKKRGIKAAAKKTAKFYANLLKKADAEAAEAEDAEADDWDEEEEEEAPKKAPAKKAAKKAEPEPEEDDDDDEDEDDDWDI